MSRPLAGKAVLVTGGSRGIGAAIARRLARDGADVAITYVASAAPAAAVVREIEALGVRGAALQADQADPASTARAVDDAAKRFGRLDVLVANAGIFAGGPLGDPKREPAALARQLAVNVTGVAAAIDAAARHLPRGGRIVAIGSVLGSRASWPGLADYGATKAAVAAYVRGFARDLGPRGIHVNLVRPGPIETDMNPQQSPLADAERATTAFGRFGQPDDIAGAVAWLVGPDSGYVTGAALDVDGGFLA